MIKSVLVYSESKVNVLDVTLHLVDGFIQTDIYSKPTDSHLYLSLSSAHRLSTFIIDSYLWCDTCVMVIDVYVVVYR